MKEVESYISPDRFWSSLHHVDYKFLIIPVVFVFLRVWTEILSILYDYIKIAPERVPTGINLLLYYLAVSAITVCVIVKIRCSLVLDQATPSFQCCPLKTLKNWEWLARGCRGWSRLQSCKSLLLGFASQWSLFRQLTAGDVTV